MKRKIGKKSKNRQIRDNSEPIREIRNNSKPIREQIQTQNTQVNVEQSIIKTPGSLQDAYLFIRQLGRGSQAKVFLAIRLADGQKVAIKQLNIGSVKTWKEYDLFHREARLLESLDIEGVANFYEAILTWMTWSQLKRTIVTTRLFSLQPDLPRNTCCFRKFTYTFSVKCQTEWLSSNQSYHHM